MIRDPATLVTVDPNSYVAATFWVQVAVAVGTLGALFVAVAVFVSELRLRRRRRVALVHAWLDWRSMETGQIDVDRRGQYLVQDGYEPVAVVMNASEQFVSDLEAFIWPTRSNRYVFSMSTDLLGPGQTYESRAGYIGGYFRDTFILPDRHTGLVAVFRDAAGYRWERRANGV